MKISKIHKQIIDPFRAGEVIPALPLALDTNGKFDELHQRALIRYYMDAGVGGLAVGVHTTQFEIRDPKHGLFKPVLQYSSEVMNDWCSRHGNQVIKIAGICGKKEQAELEARIAVDAGYHAGLLSLGALANDSVDNLIGHCQSISEIIPIMGFYLQPAVGGRVLPYSFWRNFAEIEQVLAIKIAPFNRYQTLDVVRAICDADRENDITLYTGNDDNIVLDLLTEYKCNTATGQKKVRIKGGLLGHWAVWTRKAVELLKEIHLITESGLPVPPGLLTKAMEITDSNAAFFDAANSFAGCIPGIHEVLRRQGLLSSVLCLNPDEVLSPGQRGEIERVYLAYPHLNDDEFVAENLDVWLTS